MAGELAKRLRPLMDRLAETLGLVEVGIDFSDEDVTFLPQEEVARRAAAIDASLADLVAESDRLERLSAEPTVVLVGRPNAGKSTLLNALAGHDRAVVSPVAGTTRDLLTAEVPLLRGLIRLTDAAGLDDGPALHASDARAHVESEMRRRALEAVQSADLVVLVVAADDDRPRIHVGRGVDLVVHTKSDLAVVPIGHLAVCAPAGDGLPRLREKLDELAFGRSTASHRLAINRRHLHHIDAARAALGRAQAAPAVELTALELRDALDSLGAVLGAISPDDVLGLVFSRFCIGK
jgi:tRNA modification GTPase